MIYRTTRDGNGRTRVTRTEVEGEYLFEDFRLVGGPKPTVTRSYTLDGDRANKLISALTLVNSIRFAEAYGMTRPEIRALTDQPIPVADPYATPLPGTLPFDVHAFLIAHGRGRMSLAEATKRVIDRVREDTFGEVLHQLQDTRPDALVRDQLELYRDLLDSDDGDELLPVVDGVDGRG